jgi:hypothetical protein
LSKTIGQAAEVHLSILPSSSLQEPLLCELLPRHLCLPSCQWKDEVRDVTVSDRNSAQCLERRNREASNILLSVHCRLINCKAVLSAYEKLQHICAHTEIAFIIL